MIPFLRKSVQACGIIFLGVLIASCGGDNGGGTTEPTTGTIRVTVTSDGAAVQSATVHRFAPGATTPTTSRATGSDGVATFSNVEAGTWEVEVVVPGSFELDPGEDERKSVTVTAGGTANATFLLVDAFEGETVEARDDLTFSVENLQISAGTAVRWVNVGQMLHTVTPDGHDEWSSADLASTGSTFTHTFDTPGTYEYFCQPHVGDGMTGTVTVN